MGDNWDAGMDMPGGNPSATKTLDLRAVEARTHDLSENGDRLAARVAELEGVLEALSDEVSEYLAGDEDVMPHLALRYQEARAALGRSEEP